MLDPKELPPQETPVPVSDVSPDEVIDMGDRLNNDNPLLLWSPPEEPKEGKENS